MIATISPRNAMKDGISLTMGLRAPLAAEDEGYRAAAQWGGAESVVRAPRWK